MFAMVVGILLALSFIGLPLAIIGLFVMSVLDRSNFPSVASIFVRLRSLGRSWSHSHQPLVAGPHSSSFGVSLRAARAPG
jgi:hypothetical protein